MAAIPPPPIVVNADASAVLATAQEGAAATPMARVTRASKRRKIAEGLLQTGSITEDEYGRHEVYYVQVAGAAAAGPGGGLIAPPWFGPALAAALAPIHVQLAQIDARLDGIDARLDGIDEQLAFIDVHLDDIDYQLANLSARQVNAVALDMADRLKAVRDNAGNIPANFPQTLHELNSLTGVELSALLEYYGVPVQRNGSVAEKRQRLKTFIGLRP